MKPPASMLLLAALPACQRVSTGSDELSVTASVSPDMGTVVTLSWDTSTCPGARPTVTLEPDAGEAVGSDGDGETVLLGLIPKTDYTFTLDLELDGQICATSTGTFATDKTAMDVGRVEVTGPGLGGYVMTSLVTVPAGPMMVSGDGDVVWAAAEPVDSCATVSRAVLSRDRRSVIYGAYCLYPDKFVASVNDIVIAPIDGSEATRIPTQSMHHDLVERSDGVIAYLGMEYRDIDGYEKPWRADLIVELQPDGSERVLWNAWDDFPWNAVDLPEEGTELDEQEWTHGNALQYSEEHDAYYVSMRRRSEIVKIDASSGELLWTLGSNSPDFTMASEDWFRGQHQFRVEGDELLLFDNGGKEGSLTSRAVTYRLDEEAMTAELVSEILPNPPTYVYVLGDVERQPDGNTLVSWSTSGKLESVRDDGKVDWRVAFEVGNFLGYFQRLEDLSVDEDG